MSNEPLALPESARSTGAPAIENEFPSYRAISKLSVASLILGLVSLLSFVNPWFLLAGILAIGLGALAEWKIRNLPEVLTGRGFAQFGIALGLIFGLASVTVGTVQNVLRAREATRFAGVYVKTLRTGSIDDVMWYMAPPQRRKGIAPKKLVEGMRQASPEAFAKYAAPLQRILGRLTSAPGENIRFVELEAHGDEDLSPFAFALLELKGPGSAAFPKKQEFALIRIRALSEGGIYHWWTDLVIYPYQRGSHVPEPKPIEDGHDHGHSHGA